MNKLLFRTARLGLGLAAAWLGAALPAHAQTTLANQPVFSSVAVPGNLALALSVEYPTAVSNAHTDATYAPASTYLGYFDPAKCYTYVYSATEADRYFQPAGTANNHVCSNKWSGNFLNWASMQTIDPFRWALTGGYRVTDTASTTIIEKAYATGQGGAGNFPDRSITTGSVVSGATPMNWSGIKIRIQGLGNKMRFTRTGDNNSGATTPTAFDSSSRSWNDGTVWEVSIRVKVCDSGSTAGGLESNCVAYGSNYKPEGLIQKYSQRIRFSAFGYLNDASLSRDGGVLRARQKFVGPTKPVPGSDPIANALGEWSATTGVMVTNPDPADATTTATEYGVTIDNSGVMNYLNKFGQITPGSYKTYDPVGELYYAALRYYRNLGNVPQWTNPGTNNNNTKRTYADGFPVITTWDDPILYSCQKNFILGIGDVNTHADRNLPGATGNSEPAKPASVTADTGFDAITWTNKVGQLNGNNASLGTVQNYGGCCNNNGALMAGMAYWANTQDIRPTMDGLQTVKTYWMDVLELQTYKSNNQFYLATKYGGANIPTSFNPLGTTDLTQSWWHTGAATDTVGSQLRPDTYYTAARADTMVSGLTSAFASIVASISASTSSLNTASNNVSAGTAAYGSAYDSNTWTGEVSASTISLLSTPIGYTSVWKFSDTLKTQVGTDGTGWDTRRNIVTYKPTSATTGTGVAFRLANLTSTQASALDTTYVTGNDAADYVKYLRGDKSQEISATVTTGYRARTSLLADIINSQVVVLGPPQGNLSEAANPGYAAHVRTYASRPNILIAGANSGMVHIINGSVTSTTDGGKELFAFIPNAVIAGPSGTPSVDGIASYGNPDFEHRYLVDARPTVAEVDFKRTAGSNLSANEWHSIAVGGLGKGGRSIYALDLTTANAVNSETAAASRVLWEYTESDMGFTFGSPVITKTAQYGWVVVVGSGFNNASGKGAFYILNARTGALLQKVSLPTAGDDGTVSSPTGLTYLETYYRDRQDATVESIYAGDLKGNLWRLDLTAATGAYPAPVKLATLTDAAGVALPITSTPTPVVNPSSNRRWIAVGTGQLLSTNDIPVNRLNRFYAILDGYQGRYTQSTDLPSGITMPFLENASRHDFQDISTTATPLNFNTKVGYFMDLATVGAAAGFRVINEADALENLVVFSAIRPISTNACSPSGNSITAVIDLNTGATTKTTIDFAVDETRFINDNGTIKVAVAGTPSPSTPGGGNKDGDLVLDTAGTGAGNKRLINWREVPLRN
ncbi:pilus assembly protein [Roseateles amylovorans]|uniref:PilC/PilY family type IV pilus protein n=1 Tax=Roseateles amylovorans TaxID=2978473 RepID=A0ABY6B2A6_9BURK|nr:PilC/PilY family type IV pilus protein [Roseateles amylovorans]UXH79348.1 PilC/PilY family type IV pilus protein [Roseateles amylovorans]